MKKDRTFGVVSAGISLLVLIFVFALDFLKASFMGIGGEGTSAWSLFSGDAEVGIGFLILLAVILLIANIVIQFVEIAPLSDFASKYSKKPLNILSNNITAIGCAAMFLIVGFAAPSAMKDAATEDTEGFGRAMMAGIEISMTFGAWLMIILSAAMLFVPKFVCGKTKIEF